MANTNFVRNRRNKIINILKLNGEAKVSYLSDILNVSPLTIRRDLDYLEEKNFIKRRYGIASLVNEYSNDYSSTEIQAKTAIAKYAATLIQDNETIFINTSSTALMIIPYIKAKNVNIITNNAQTVNLPLPENVNIILTGGELRIPKEAMVGDFALESLKIIRADKAFVGCSGLCPIHGLSTAVMQEAPVNNAMVEQAREVIVVADHTKLNILSNFCYASINKINTLITDNSKEFYETHESFKKNGVKVLTVSPFTLLTK